VNAGKGSLPVEDARHAASREARPRSRACRGSGRGGGKRVREAASGSKSQTGLMCHICAGREAPKTESPGGCRSHSVPDGCPVSGAGGFITKYTTKGLRWAHQTMSLAGGPTRRRCQLSPGALAFVVLLFLWVWTTPVRFQIASDGSFGRRVGAMTVFGSHEDLTHS